MKNHPLIRSLLSLRGNPKACVLTEPLWGIPYQLYMPFATLYMVALGASDSQVGIIAAVTLFFRAVSAMLSGVVTDKLGRRRTTIIFDLISWSLPCLLWMCAQNFYWFMAAAVFNGLWQMTENSWTCLLVEDAEKDQMVNIYSWIHMSGQLAVFFAPLSGLLMRSVDLVPAMRVLYLFSFLSMTAKFLILYRYCDETKTGRIRKEQTKGQSIWSALGEYKGLLAMFFRSGSMVLALALLLLFNITTITMQNFFGLYSNKNLLMPEEFLAYFPILRAVIMMVFLFWLQPKMYKLGVKLPMLLGILVYIGSHLVLIFSPAERLSFIVIYVVGEACAHALVMTRKDSLVALFVDERERARVMSIINTLMLGVSIPFGYLGGWLSDWDRRLPFVMNVCVFGVAFVLIFLSRRISEVKVADS